MAVGHGFPSRFVFSGWPSCTCPDQWPGGWDLIFHMIPPWIQWGYDGDMTQEDLAVSNIWGLRDWRFKEGIRFMALYGGFHKWRYPKMEGIKWKIPWKWMIWGYPPFLETSICMTGGYQKSNVCCFQQWVDDPNWRSHVFSDWSQQPDKFRYMFVSENVD